MFGNVNDGKSKLGNPGITEGNAIVGSCNESGMPMLGNVKLGKSRLGSPGIGIERTINGISKLHGKL